jgi:hypothetical protein
MAGPRFQSQLWPQLITSDKRKSKGDATWPSGDYIIIWFGPPKTAGIVVAIPPKHAVAYVVKRLKGASSHHLNHAGSLDYHFAWQPGYGALTLGENQRPKAEAYVAHQKAHHADQTANAWLERYTEFREGPAETGIPVSPLPHAVREEPELYTVWGEPPF